jgi:hypothetical protein
MIVKAFKLPEPFLRMAPHIPSNHLMGWELKDYVDAYGNPFESELTEFYPDQVSILRATDELPKYFQPDGEYGEPGSPGEKEPGFIPDVVDFSKILCFGVDGGDAPFCLDYRDDVENPSVIYWADAWWRRVAPDFASFIALYDVGAAA